MALNGLAARPLQTTRSILLGFPVALFAGGLLSDIAYLRTEVIQWTNFSQWLIFGAEVFTGVLLAWSAISLVLQPGLCLEDLRRARSRFAGMTSSASWGPEPRQAFPVRRILFPDQVGNFPC